MQMGLQTNEWDYKQRKNDIANNANGIANNLLQYKARSTVGVQAKPIFSETPHFEEFCFSTNNMNSVTVRDSSSESLIFGYVRPAASCDVKF